MFIPLWCQGCFYGKVLQMLGLSHGMKCKREDSIKQRLEHWVWGPQTCVWAGTLSPNLPVTSWLHRDVNPCPARLPGLLWEWNETPSVKSPFQATVLHKCKLLWFSLVVFGKLVSFYISHVSSALPLPPQSDQKCLPFSSEQGTSDLTIRNEATRLTLAPVYV